VNKVSKNGGRSRQTLPANQVGSNGANGSVVNRIYEKWPRAVIVTMLPASKGPGIRKWQKTTFDDTQTPKSKKHLAAVERRGGNFGILQGSPSDNIIAIDFDVDSELEDFLAKHPFARDSWTTRGSRGGQIWLHMEGKYPEEKFNLYSDEGEPIGEWRGGGGCQSVVWGLHENRVDHYSWSD